MITKNINISKINGNVQHLSDIYPMIESNTILNKTITGIGATYSEIKAPRNSIIIEPTKPVIYGKKNDPKHKNDNILGVFQKITKEKIVEYIEKSIRQKKWIKIITTPESFKKVHDAFEELDIDIRFDGYFLLLDECQKIIKDCDYRQDITLPMNLFFECKDKAMVSATPPTEFTDPRFKDFTLVKIEPDFDFKIELNLHTTNNVLQCTKELLKSLETEEYPVFLFVNSTDIIYSLMNQLGIKEKSAVFCSEKSVAKLKQLKFKATYEEWSIDKMTHFNWMTSRFYSALDIELPVKPIVIMVTDCYRLDYTMIDPYMDAVQIVGRFRNGVSAIYHISNTNSYYKVKSREYIILKLEQDKIVYDYLETMANSASTPEQREAFADARDAAPIKKFLKEDRSIDYFGIDNYIDEELLKSYYNCKENLQKAYDACGYFNISHDNHFYKLGDYERLKIANQNLSIRQKQKEIVNQLEQLGECETEADIEYKRGLEFADPFIVKAYDTLGKTMIEKLNYSKTKIKEAIIKKEHQERANSTDALRLIYTKFRPRTRYTSKDIKMGLKEIFSTLNIPTPKAITAKTIEEYFHCVEDNKRNNKGYMLLEPRFHIE